MPAGINWHANYMEASVLKAWNIRFQRYGILRKKAAPTDKQLHELRSSVTSEYRDGFRVH